MATQALGLLVRLHRLAAMSAVDNLVTDMNHSRDLIAARKDVDRDGAITRALQKKCATSIAAKISYLPYLSHAEAMHLLQSAKHCGQDESGEQIIVAAVDAKLSVALEKEEVKPPSAKTCCSPTLRVGSPRAT